MQVVQGNHSLGGIELTGRKLVALTGNPVIEETERSSDHLRSPPAIPVSTQPISTPRAPSTGSSTTYKCSSSWRVQSRGTAAMKGWAR
eukprot:764847-Hanusia_phi.AAC.3